jgi:hypothetical protein
MKLFLQALEELFYGDNTLKEVLPSLKEELERVDYYSKIMIQGLIENTEELKKSLYEITGLYGIIIEAYHFSEGALDVKEPAAKAKIRADAIKAAEKLTDGAIAAKAELEVSQYRRVRSYLLGYTNNLEKTISTMQSILKFEGSPKGNVARPNTKENVDQPGSY